MIEVKKTIKYEVQEKQKACEWKAVTYPIEDYAFTLYIYKTDKENYPNVEFRIRKITTTKRIEILEVTE